jgi:YHS domain-containing protein
MEGILYLVFIALWFYLMMRYGCGAHIMHGHHGHSSGANHLDPVCGMKVKPMQGYGKMYHGNLYRFCTKSCLDKFDLDPEKYLNMEQKEEM